MGIAQYKVKLEFTSEIQRIHNIGNMKGSINRFWQMLCKNV